MIYLNTESLPNVLSAKILDEDKLHFENGLAVAKVYVRKRDFYNYEKNFTTYTVIKEVRDYQTNEVIEYKIAGSGEYFNLPAYLLDIIRFGNHFIFKVWCSNDDENVFFESYYHYEYNQVNDNFEKVEKLNGTPVLTKNPDIVILNTSKGDQLYHLVERVFIGKPFSEIEDIDGNYFLVTNKIEATNESSLRNNLIFVIDKYGNKTSKVYSRNKNDFTEDEINVPYDEIEEREIQLLINALNEEKKIKELFRSCGKIEQ